MPHHPQYDFYVECINFKENGAAQPGGNDYSACAITHSLLSTMSKTDAHFCPCEQNVSRDRSINVSPTEDGGVITILLYLGQVKVQLKAAWTDGQLLVDEVAAKGDFEVGPVAFQNKPSPTPNNAPAPPPNPNPGELSGAHQPGAQRALVPPGLRAQLRGGVLADGARL